MRSKEDVIKMTIRTWEEMKIGIYHWSEKKRYTPEYCQTQIDYFKEKLKNESKTKNVVR